jgi:hypothetical protein
LIAGSERRYFVLNFTPYAAEAGASIPEPVAYCAEVIASPFFSVDVARRADGVERIVESCAMDINKGYSSGEFQGSEALLVKDDRKL